MTSKTASKSKAKKTAKKKTTSTSKTKKAQAKKAATSSTTKSAGKTKTSATKSKKVKSATRKASTPTKSRKPKSSKGNGSGADKRAMLIQQEAYFIAEKRGFEGGDPVQDWLMAERQVDEMLKNSSL